MNFWARRRLDNRTGALRRLTLFFIEPPIANWNWGNGELHYQESERLKGGILLL